MKPTPPPLTTQIVSFGGALLKESGAIVAGQEPVTAEEQHARLSICTACPYYDNGRCLICGCDMQRKTGFRTAQCAAIPPKW